MALAVPGVQPSNLRGLSLLQFLLRRIAPQSAWRGRLYAHFDRHPFVPLPDMGANAAWRTHDLWR